MPNEKISNQHVAYIFIYEKIDNIICLGVGPCYTVVSRGSANQLPMISGFSEKPAPGFSSSWLLPMFMVNASRVSNLLF